MGLLINIVEDCDPNIERLLEAKINNNKNNNNNENDDNNSEGGRIPQSLETLSFVSHNNNNNTNNILYVDGVQL